MFNKWVKIADVNGNIGDSLFSYKPFLHSGENKFRIKTQYPKMSVSLKDLPQGKNFVKFDKQTAIIITDKK